MIILPGFPHVFYTQRGRITFVKNGGFNMMSTTAFFIALVVTAQTAPIDIGSRLELMVDDYLIESMNGASLQLHHPESREVVLSHDKPWEGSMCDYHTVFRDGDIFRMYYTSWNLDITPEGGARETHPLCCSYAESKDGKHWDKPNLGLFEFEGSKDNSIVWMGEGAHDLDPFIDENPNCKPEMKYKAVTFCDKALWAFQSPDAIHWTKMPKNPIITKGAFDTQNIAFWDAERGVYRVYLRDFHNGVRDIRTATSPDFENWTEPVQIQFPGAPDEALYTNQVKPYYRAPHLLLGFPTRYVERKWSSAIEALPDPEFRARRAKASERYGAAVTDGLFMSSRDGLVFKRWGEAFLRPGIERRDNWVYGDCYQNWGLIETTSDVPNAPNEISFFFIENNWKPNCQLRRYTIRIDGFVSVNAPRAGGEIVTKPLIFDGSKLTLNFSASAAGSIRVEIQDVDGHAITGYSLDETPEILGDSLDRVIAWKDGKDLTPLRGKPVKLRFALVDADLYSIQFRP
jgi:hypothetical protein